MITLCYISVYFHVNCFCFLVYFYFRVYILVYFLFVFYVYFKIVAAGAVQSVHTSRGLQSNGFWWINFETKIRIIYNYIGVTS